MAYRDFSVYDIICRNAQIYGDRECIVSDDTRLTHRQYKENCDKIAEGLLRSGVEKEDRLGIVANNCAEFMLLYGAVARIGAILLPVNWRFQQNEVEYVLNDCAPKFVFAGPGYGDVVAESAKKVSSIKKCYAIGQGHAYEGFVPFDELLSEKGVAEDIGASADAAYVIIHTAAVEGRPRGAILSQGNMVYDSLQMMYLHALSNNDCHICFLPLFHIAGLSMTMAVMHAGGKNVILERFDPEQTLRSIHDEKGTTFMQFPPILQMITDKYRETNGKYNLSSIRNIGGLDKPENIFKFKEIARNARFWTAYGQTEAMPVTGGLIEERPGSAGKPTALSRLALFDDDDNEVAFGDAGEICVRSPVAFLGYWGRDEDNAYTLRNGWHHTGDIGRFDSDGYLWYVGRKAQKDLIKPGGENVYPAEVEKAILEHPDILEATVIGVPDEQWGEAIKAVCALRPGKSLEESTLIDFVASKIARYKKPKYVSFVDSLPKTRDGYIDREAVKKSHGGK